MFVKSTLFPKEPWKKRFISWAKKKKRKKKSETNFFRRKTAEDDNAKTNVSLNIPCPCTILLFKASTFLQISFPRISTFWEHELSLIVNAWNSFTSQPIYFFNWTKEHPLKISNKRTYISFLINLLFQSQFESRLFGLHFCIAFFRK